MKAPRAARSHRDFGKLFRTGLLVLALVLQGYLSQVHHHDFAATALLATTADGDTTGSPMQPIDSGGRDHHCFICHLSGHGSISMLPQAVVLAVVSAGIVVYLVARDPLDLRNTSSAYSSRAPPSRFIQA